MDGADRRDAAAMLFGLVPGLRMAGGNLQEALKDSGAGSGQSRKHERLRSVLVVSEVALACMLLVGAGLLLRSFLKVLDVDLGFQPERAAAVKVEYDDLGAREKQRAGCGGKNLAARSAYFQQLLERVSALPGVEAAGISDYLPLAAEPLVGIAVSQGCRSGRTSCTCPGRWST